jgi:hypothetical protein
LDEYVFLNPSTTYRLPGSFDFADNIETERELWALFPETDGKRVNFFQIGLTAQLFVEMPDTSAPLTLNETYVFMPCEGNVMKPIRMRAGRRLSLSEYRMAHLTAIKMIGKLGVAGETMQLIGRTILGPEVLDEVRARINDCR